MTIRKNIRGGLYLALFFLCAAALQWHAGAFRAEFSSDPDEPAHYVTGLLFRDYVAAGFPGAPLQYARNYYLHYPKVAIGHWPPLFYLLQAAWTLIFTPSRISVMLFLAALTAAVGWFTWSILRARFSPGVSVGAVLILLSLPAFQEYSHDVMAEMLMALLVLLAVIAYGSYIDSGRWQAAAWFGIWSALALLTKGSGIQLAFIPPLTLAITGRWRLLRRFSFWLPAGIVLVLALPWYAYVPDAQHESVARFGGVAVEYSRFTESIALWGEFLGLIPSLAALAGVAVVIAAIRKRTIQGVWIALMAALLGAYTTRLFLGAFEARHLVVSLPLLLIFAAAGWDRIFDRDLLRRWRSGGTSRSVAAAVAAVAVAGLIGFNISRSHAKTHFGYAELAQELLAQHRFRSSVLLVCSDSTGEGMLISETAMHEQRPGHIILRASKMLASSDWMGYDYRPLFDDLEQQLRLVEAIPAGVIVIDDAGRNTPHGRLLYQGIISHPEKWQRVDLPAGNNRDESPAANILVYELRGQERMPAGKIKIPMRFKGYGDMGN